MVGSSRRSLLQQCSDLASSLCQCALSVEKTTLDQRGRRCGPDVAGEATIVAQYGLIDALFGSEEYVSLTASDPPVPQSCHVTIASLLPHRRAQLPGFSTFVISACRVPFASSNGNSDDGFGTQEHRAVHR